MEPIFTGVAIACYTIPGFKLEVVKFQKFAKES
jgi:hypothetical protein